LQDRGGSHYLLDTQPARLGEMGGDMVRAILRFVACVVLTFLIAVAVASAKGRDRSLLALVPAGSRLVAGMSAPTTPGQPDSYLLLTHNNRVDLADFFALTGVDTSRVIHQVVLVAGSDAGQSGAHSLLASGYFDRTRIWKAALVNGASATEWRGVPVVVVEPFARTQGVVQKARWLAVPRPDLAILGSEASVREELDRELERTEPDADLMHRLGRLRTDDASWCVVTALPERDEIGLSLEAFDPALPRLLHAGDGFAFGTRFGASVEFEYEVTASKGTQAEMITNTVAESLLANERARSARDGERDKLGAARGVIKVSKARYEAWLAGILSRGHAGGVDAGH
jgi:hypothetical protein